MRRTATTLALAAAALLLTAGVAAAESQTVSGDTYGGNPGDITKMAADNGRTAVTTRVWGIGKPCSGAQSLQVYLENARGRTLYFAQGTCTAGVEWNTALYYTSTGDIQDQVRVRCRAFEFSRVRASGAYRIVMPRGCIDKAPNRVRVEADGVNYGSATGGHAGPTRVLARG